MSFDVEKFAAGVHDYLARALRPIADRLKSLEERPPVVGDRGDKGDPGENGKDGAAGQRGDKGEKGDKGDQGERGENGEKGDQGEKGERGHPGQDGSTGMQGGKGDSGENGKDGMHAVEIRPLMMIDDQRSYSAGTWAKHAGGLWLARQDTVGMDGWDCIISGIASIDIDLSDDMRSVSVSVQLSAGRIETKTLSMPAIIYRGIWKEDDQYSRGDSTTREGSMWILTDEDQKGRPGDADSGWTLSAKRGNHGRDGLKGEKGERGAGGRDGQDLTQLGPDGRKW